MGGVDRRHQGGWVKASGEPSRGTQEKGKTGRDWKRDHKAKQNGNPGKGWGSKERAGADSLGGGNEHSRPREGAPRVLVPVLPELVVFPSGSDIFFRPQCLLS